jgi:sugar-phosphatase
MTFALTADDGRELAVDAVLFDMDGTIVDSIAATERIWSAFADEHGALHLLRIDHGRPAEYTIASFLPHLEGDDLHAVLLDQRAREARDLEGVHPIPGALELIAALHESGIPWGVVTSADAVLARARLGHCGIEPPMLVTRDDVYLGKPDPEPFALGAHRLGRPPERCLVIEDAVPGVQSGRGAGCPTAGIGDIGADIRLADIHDLHSRLFSRDA